MTIRRPMLASVKFEGTLTVPITALKLQSRATISFFLFKEKVILLLKSTNKVKHGHFLRQIF